MPRKYTLEEILRKISDIHGDNISLLENSDKGPLAKFICNICGYVWVTSRSSVFSGCGCEKCAIRKNANDKRFSVEEVREQIKDGGCELIQDFYINFTTPILIKFECGHEYAITLASFKRGNRCPECGRRRMNEKTRYTEGDVMDIVQDNGLRFMEFIGGTYINNTTKIKYLCQYGHETIRDFATFLVRPSCKECSKERRREEIRGAGHHNWKGNSKIRLFCMQQIDEWKLESAKNCGYKCVITGKNFDDIHHLYSFNKILSESIEELGLTKLVKAGDYAQEDLMNIVDRVRENHKKYPLGVCLTRDVHKLFHSYYGNNNNTPSQFTEFLSRIKSGEIIISN